MQFTNISMLWWWIALFLFGMMLFEETIHNVLWENVKTSIKKHAWWLLKTIGIGTLSTAILQSSTIVIMLTLGFMGANILSLTQWIGMVLWANLWTTLTPRLIATLWFEINITTLTLPIIGVWGIVLLLGSRYPKLLTTAKFFLSFGLLFLGLWYMKESVDILASSFSLSDSSIGLWYSIALGTIITIVMQTSTGASILTLTALSSWIITFEIGLGMIIGANVWSAITTFLVWFLSTTGKHYTKKVIAAAHLLFNIGELILMLIIFKPIQILLNISWLSSDPIIGIAAFHTLYNLIWVIVLAPFAKIYVSLIRKHFPKVDSYDETVFFIEQCSTNLAEEYVVAMKKDIQSFWHEITILITSMYQHDNPEFIDTYTHLKNNCENRISKVLQYDITNTTKEQQNSIESYQLSIVEFLGAIKQLKDILFHYYNLRQSSSLAIQHYMDQFDEKLTNLTSIINFWLQNSESSSYEKITQWEKMLMLDDGRFLKDIRTSISHHHDDKENHHYRSQLMKVNWSIVIASRSCLDGLLAYLKWWRF